MEISNILKLSSIYYKLIFGQQKFWGKKGSGILFICSEDRTMLLAYRSDYVMDGNCWGIPGGAVEKGYSDIQSAKKQVKEELGGLPSNMKYIKQTLWTAPDGKFKYRTFICDIPLSSKNEWEIKLNPENTEYKWFDLDQPPPVKLHFGVPHVHNLLPKSNKIFTLSDKQLSIVNK